MRKLPFKSAFTIFIILFTHFAHAQVVVTPGTFPTMCQGSGGFLSQTTPIIMAEKLPTDFGINSSEILYYIQFPTGYEFDPTNLNVTHNAGDIVNFSFQSYQNGILIGYDCPTQTKRDTIKISGILLYADLGAPTNINVVRTAVPSGLALDAPQNGNMVANAQNHMTLKSTYPPAVQVPTISISKNFFCHDDNNLYPITVSPAGGTITPALGIIGTNFKPSAAQSSPSGIGTPILYSYNYLGCPFYASTGAEVQDVPSPTITDDDADNIICAGQSVKFTALPNTGAYRFQFLKNGVLVQGPSTIQNTYTTTALADGDVISVIQDTGPGSCSATVADAPFTVVTVPTPSITVPTLPALVCSNNTNSYAVTVSPAGGTLSGTGISGNNFVPTSASVGSNTITYAGIYNTCSYSTTINVTVTSAPSVVLASGDPDNIICQGDSITFYASVYGTASRYLFIKNGNGIQGPNASSTYGTKTLANGDAISVIVDNGSATCPSTSNTIITTVGQYPKASFTWQNTCGTNTVNFTNNSTIPSGSTITQYAWDFNNANVTDATTVASSYTYPAANTYHAKLTVTSDKGCIDDTLTRIYTLPGFTPTVSNPYTIDFTTSNQGWAYDGLNPSWGWGTASSAFGQGTRKLWSTGQSSGTYDTNERSYLYGPCVNLSSLDKPMIALRLSSAINGEPAGTILEVTTDEGLNWEKVGAKDFGQNWYNENGIVSTPSSTLANTINNNPSGEGWTDNLAMQLSRFSLQKYVGKTSVRFRLNFASVSDVHAVKYAGFALDSVFIGNRNKLVLLEHFTNDANTFCAAAISALNFIQSKRPTDIVEINYHASIGGYDSYNQYNTADPSARVLFYSVSQDPITFPNGQLNNAPGYTTYNAGIGKGSLDTNVIDNKSLDPAKFKIEMSNTITQGSPGSVYSVAKITYINEQPYSSNIVVNFVILEDTASNNTSENYVERKMLPDAGGTYISRTWNKNDAITVPQTWSDNFISGNKKLGVVVFVQNITTKEVYQAAYLKGSGDYGSHVVASINDSLINDSETSVYPNPANNEVYIIYGSSIKEDYKWEIYDNLGRLVESNISTKGVQGFSINTATFAEGTYYLKIANSKNLVTKKLIIVH